MLISEQEEREWQVTKDASLLELHRSPTQLLQTISHRLSFCTAKPYINKYSFAAGHCVQWFCVYGKSMGQLAFVHAARNTFFLFNDTDRYLHPGLMY